MPVNCRHCGQTLTHQFIDLGYAPPSNAYLDEGALHKPEIYYPLDVQVCNKCWLVQTKDFVAADEMFNAKYAYFSSVSSGWLKHAADYSNMIIPKLALGENSHVIEIASNDGYLLKNFIAAQIPCLGIEPTKDTANASRELGIPVVEEFFTSELATELCKKGQQADLIIGNNVLAHVPDINDFVAGLHIILKDTGVITMEFPHVQKLIAFNQFDTIYHEHFSYLSLHAVTSIFQKAELDIFDVEELPTHGGSLRIYASKATQKKPRSNTLKALLNEEKMFGLLSLETYTNFQKSAEVTKHELLSFLLKLKAEKKSVLAYGAAAKGNTLLNYAGVKPDLLPGVCDSAPSKQGKFMPGSHIPILSPEVLNETPPDYLIILPWNIKNEVKQQLKSLTDTTFVTLIPSLEVGI
jgi:hypothetical protein